MKTNLLSVGAICLLSSVVLKADYVAYSILPDGEKAPLPEDVSDFGATELLNVEWGEYSGKQTRIGVLEVENKSSSSTYSVSGFGGMGGNVEYNPGAMVPVQGIEAIITDVMHKTARFRMVERKVLDQAIQEQDLGASGRVAQPSAAKVGNILGAQYLLQAVVTNYEAGVKKQGGGLLGGAIGGKTGAIIGGLSMNSSTGVIGMNFRLIDSETTEVVFTNQVEVAVKESGLSFGGVGFAGGAGLGGFMSGYAKTPIGQAVISACNRGVYDLIKQIGTSPAEGSVVTVRDGKVYLNLGSDSVGVGEKILIQSKGEALIDPETGISLGSDTTDLGHVEVASVQEKFSIANNIDCDLAAVTRGNAAISLKPAEPLQFSAEWDRKKSGSSKKKKKGLF